MNQSCRTTNLTVAGKRKRENSLSLDENTTDSMSIVDEMTKISSQRNSLVTAAAAASSEKTPPAPAPAPPPSGLLQFRHESVIIMKNKISTWKLESDTFQEILQQFAQNQFKVLKSIVIRS